MSEEKKSAVANGELIYTSVSAMQKADRCLRQWRFRYVEGLPDNPPSKGQKRGTEGHNRIEVFLKTGKNVLDPLEVRGMQYMPEPNVSADGKPHPVPVLVEEHFGRPTPMHADGVPMTGYMDLVNPRTLQVENGLLEIKDWKFKKDIAKYGCSAEDLIDPKHESGIQMLGYAAWAARARDRFPGMNRLRLNHVTFQTQGPQDVVQVRQEITLTDALDGWETVSRRIVPRMRVAAKAATPYEVDKNTDHCEAYGGCPYKQTCLSRMARVASNIKQLAARKAQQGEVKMGMLSQVLNQPIHTESQPAAPRALIKDESAPMPKAKDSTAGQQYRVGGQLAVFLCNVGPQSTFLPVAGGQPIVVPGDTPVIPPSTGTPAATGASGTVQAPATAGAVATSSTVAGSPQAVSTKPKSDPAPAAVPVVLSPDAPRSNPALAAKIEQPVQATPSAAQAVAEQAPAPTKRTRKPKAEAAPASEPIPNDSRGGDDEPDFSGVHLYFVGCPAGVKVDTLSAYVEAVEQATRDAGQIPETVVDIRTCSDTTFGFGKWKGFMHRVAQSMAPPPGHYLVTYGDERVQCVAEAILPLLSPGNAVLGGR